MGRVSLFEQVTCSRAATAQKRDSSHSFLPGELSAMELNLLAAFEDNLMSELEDWQAGNLTAARQRKSTIREALRRGAPQDEEDLPQCTLSPSKIPRPTGRSHTVRSDLVLKPDDVEPLDSGHPVLRRILRPKGPALAPPRRASSDVGLGVPAPPSAESLGRAIAQLEQRAQATWGKSSRRRSPKSCRAHSAGKDFCDINRRNIAVLVKMRKEGIKRIPSLEKAVRREKHRREVEGRRDAQLTDREEQVARCQRQVELENRLSAQRVQLSRRAMMWSGIVLMMRPPKILDARFQHTLETMKAESRTLARHILQVKLVPLWRNARKRKLRRNFFVLCRVAHTVVLWKLFMRRKVTDRVHHFLQIYVNDTTLAIKRYHRVTRRTQALVMRLLCRRRAEASLLNHWLWLCEAWVIMQDSDQLAAGLPNEAEVRESAHKTRSFMTRRGHRTPLHLKLVSAAEPPLATYRHFFYNNSVPAAPPGGCVYDQIRLSARVRRLWDKVRLFVYKKFQRPRVLKRQKAIEQRRVAIRAVLDSARPDSPATPRAKRAPVMPHPPPGGCLLAKRASNVLLRRLTQLRTTQLPSMSAPERPNDKEVLPKVLSDLRLPDAMRQKLLVSLFRRFDKSVNEAEFRDRVAYTLRLKLRHLYPQQSAPPPTSRRKVMLSLVNEQVILHHIRRAFSECSVNRRVQGVVGII